MVRADFELSFEPNTPPFNMDQNNPTPFQPFQAFGILTFTLSDEVNNPAASTVPYTNVTGELYATDDSFYISPVEFLGGSMTNVVRNSGVPVSGTVEDLSMRWEMHVFPGTPQELTLFTKVGLPFNGDIPNILDPEGAVIAGPDPFEIFLDDGGAGTLVAMGQNRTLTVVPEPGTFALFGVFALGLVGCGIWRRRR